ncbi:MAG: class I SAM-dependent DNA methyltransferase [Bacillota bacterium]
MIRYGGLAAIYDHLVAGVDFQGWADYVEKLIGHYGYSARSVLDLACGTGNTLFPFAARGYRAFGVDISPEMIMVAGEKARERSLKIDFFVEDMREFVLGRQVDLVTCFHDGLNYITEPEQLGEVFARTYTNLAAGGMFVFDMNAVDWIGEVDGSPVVIEDGDLTITYSTAHDREASLWTVEVTCVVRGEKGPSQFKETHCERGYSVDQVRDLLAGAGLIPLAEYDAFSFSPPHPGSRRHFYIARRP